MSRDPHKLIKQQAEFDGWPEGEYVHPEAFQIFQQTKSVLQSPQERVAALQRLDEIIGTEDGSSLKSRAEIFNLRRKLAQTHSELLKNGR